MAVTSADFSNIARAISAYASEAYTDNMGLMGTSLVGDDVRKIDTTMEDYYGTLRYDKPLGPLNFTTTQTTTDTHINRATETDDEGLTTDMSTYSETYIKSYLTIGCNQYNVTQVLTGRQTIIAKLARDWANRRRETDETYLFSILAGIAAEEAAEGAGGQTAANIRTGARGFFYDTHDGTNARPLIDVSSDSAALDRILEAITYGWGDLQDQYAPYYVVLSPVNMLRVRQANIFDENGGITESGYFFNTALQGQLRFIQTGRSLGDNSAADNVDGDSDQTSFVIRAGALTYRNLAVVNPVAFDNDESLGRGAGRRELWLRWGHIIHPRGYDFTGTTTDFALPGDMDAAADWDRTADVGNLSILPIFHS